MYFSTSAMGLNWGLASKNSSRSRMARRIARKSCSGTSTSPDLSSIQSPGSPGSFASGTPGSSGIVLGVDQVDIGAIVDGVPIVPFAR